MSKAWWIVTTAIAAAALWAGLSGLAAGNAAESQHAQMCQALTVIGSQGADPQDSPAVLRSIGCP